MQKSQDYFAMLCEIVKLYLIYNVYIKQITFFEVFKKSLRYSDKKGENNHEQDQKSPR